MYLLRDFIHFTEIGYIMRFKADNDSAFSMDSAFFKAQDSTEVIENTLQANQSQNQSQHQIMCFKHQDSALSAVLYFDDETALWIIEYTRCDQVISSALYQSESTAYLILRSHGYEPNQATAC